MVPIIIMWKSESVHIPIPFYLIVICDTQRADICMTVYKAVELLFIFYWVLHLLVLFTLLLVMVQRMCCFLLCQSCFCNELWTSYPSISCLYYYKRVQYGRTHGQSPEQPPPPPWSIRVASPHFRLDSRMVPTQFHRFCC